MPASPIRLVCFDLGGVVFRICGSLAEGCAAAGLERRNDVDALAGARDGFAELNARYQCGLLDVDEFAARLSRLVRGLYTPEELVRIHEAWILAEYEGIAEVVASIHDLGIETAALSNTCAAHWRILERYPTFRALRHRIGSHQIGRLKPDPLAYRAIEERTGFHGPAIAFFDDLFKNVEAARRLGWRAERIDPKGSPAEQIERALRESE